MTKRGNSDSKSRLMVEGSDDQHVVIQLMKRHGYDWDRIDPEAVYVEDCKGVDTLLDAPKIAAAVKTYHRLGFVFDADESPLRRWQGICNVLNNHSLVPPASPSLGGWIADVASSDIVIKRIGVWMMPDNSNKGMLETFLESMNSPDDPLWKYSAEANKQALSHGSKVVPARSSKARVHTFLAWQEEPGKPLGQAVNAKMFDANGELATRFVAWFHRLFTAP